MNKMRIINSLKLCTSSIFLLLLCYIPFHIQAQPQPSLIIDSLWQVYHLEKTDTGQIKTLSSLVLQYELKLDRDSAKILAHKMLERSLAISNDKFTAEAYLKLARIAHNLRETKTDLKYCVLAISTYKAINDEMGESIALSLLGLIFKRLKKYEAAIDNLEKSLILAKKVDDKIGIIDNYNRLAATYKDMNYKDKALALCEKSIMYYKTILETNETRNLNISTFSRFVASSYYYKGEIYLERGDYLSALKSFEQILSLTNNSRHQAFANEQIGLIYFRIDNYEKAKEYLNRVLEIRKQEKGAYLTGRTYYYIGNIYKKENNRKEALIYYLESLNTIPKEFLDIDWPKIAIANIYIETGEINKALELEKELKESKFLKDKPSNKYYFLKIKLFELKRDWRNALLYAEKAYQLAKKEQNLSEELEASNFLLKIYQALKQPNQALKYALLKQELRDSLFREENTKTVQTLAIEYETEKKETEIKNLEQEKKLQAVQLQNQQYNLYLILGLGLISLLLALLFYTNNRKNKKIANREAKLRMAANHLFANVSHEFKTPLAILRIPLEEMHQGTFKGNFEQMYGVMLKNVHRLTELVNQMLDLSKMQEKQVPLNLEYGDPVDFTRMFIGQFTSYAEQKKLQLQLELPLFSLSLKYDEEILTKILNNLVSNALKYTEQGRVLIHLKYHRQTLEFIVKDTGIGIAAKDIPHIFDRYYSNPLDTNRVASFGLGLSLVKQLVDLYKGKIEVESELGVGTTFKVTLPHTENFANTDLPQEYECITFNRPLEVYKKNSLPTTVLANTLGTSYRKKGNNKLKKLLIIEDSQDLNNLIYNRLINDYQVYQAFNGIEGFEMATKIVPDVVLTDIMMPGLDGLSLAKKMQETLETSHIPLIVFSALKNSINQQEVFEVGAIDFIAKPIEFELLEQKIQNLVYKRAQFKAAIQKNNWLPIDGEKHLSSRDEIFLEDFRKVLLQNISDKEMNVERLSQLMYMSRVSLYRKVKSLTGITPTALIYKIKMQRAYELLQQNVGTVSEITEITGFKNPSFFARKFKEEFGKSPGVILKNKIDDF